MAFSTSTLMILCPAIILRSYPYVGLLLPQGSLFLVAWNVVFYRNTKHYIWLFIKRAMRVGSLLLSLALGLNFVWGGKGHPDPACKSGWHSLPEHPVTLLSGPGPVNAFTVSKSETLIPSFYKYLSSNYRMPDNLLSLEKNEKKWARQKYSF